MTASLPEYKYTPLQPPSTIRLLELLPARPSTSTPTSPLHIRLLPYTLSAAQDTYTALSYAWGPDTPAQRKPIVCDGARLAITPTLHSALTRLRYAASSRLVWADALCIDQGNVRERAQQVRLMREIFAKARNVVVDLGEVDEKRDALLLECFGELERIGEEEWARVTAKFKYPIVWEPRETRLKDAGKVEPWVTSAVGMFSSFVARAVLGAPSMPRWEVLFNEPQVWTGFKRFTERPWFGRLWVIQELALAKRVDILVGSSLKSELFLSHTLPRLRTHFDNFLDSGAGKNLPKEDLVSPTSQRHKNLSNQLLEVRDRFISSSDPLLSLTDAFTMTNLASCSDPRDKVYAILGLVNAKEAAEISVDYTESAENLAFRIITHFIQHGKGVYALYNATGCNSAGASWTLSLEHRIETDQLASFVLPLTTYHGGPYHACGSTTPVLLSNESTHKLITKGYILDTISDLAGTLVDSILPGTAPDRLRWQLETAAWIEKHKIHEPFVPPEIIGRRTVQKDNMIRQMAIQHSQTLAALNYAFEIACWTTAIADIIRPTAYTPQRGQNNRVLHSYIHAFKEYLISCVQPLTETRKDALEARLERILEAARPYLGSLEMAYNRRLGITQEKLTCLVPGPTQIGDAVCILLGCPIPFVLRPCGDEWRLVGCCYIHNFMDGQVLQISGLTAEDITIC